MIKQVKAFNPAAAANEAAKRGTAFNLTTVAAYIRHNCTDYDLVCKALSTDEAEAFIISTYNIVTSIAPATNIAMKAWAQKKVNTLA